MFQITNNIQNHTGGTKQVVCTGDVKDVRDIIIGITGEEELGGKVLCAVGKMRFGDVLVSDPSVVAHAVLSEAASCEEDEQ